MNTPIDQGRTGNRTPVSCPLVADDIFRVRERMLDKTIADSFPASDPPSTDPAPGFDSFTV
jgi:hypothetical protein